MHSFIDRRNYQSIHHPDIPTQYHYPKVLSDADIRGISGVDPRYAQSYQLLSVRVALEEVPRIAENTAMDKIVDLHYKWELIAVHLYKVLYD